MTHTSEDEGPFAPVAGYDLGHRSAAAAIVTGAALAGLAAWRTTFGGDARSGLEPGFLFAPVAAAAWLVRRVVPGGRRLYASALVVAAVTALFIAHGYGIGHSPLPIRWVGLEITAPGAFALGVCTFVCVLLATGLQRRRPPGLAARVMGYALAIPVVYFLLGTLFGLVHLLSERE